MLCFRKTPLAKKFMDNRRAGEHQDFPSKFFCVTMPKILVGEPFSVSLISGIEKSLCFRGLCHSFLSNNFVAECRKISYGNLFVLCFRKFPVAKKFMDRREGKKSRSSLEDFLSHSAEKIRRGTLQVVTGFGYR